MDQNRKSRVLQALGETIGKGYTDRERNYLGCNFKPTSH